MTDETISLYITDIEAFLKGDRDYSMSVYRTNYFSSGKIPDHWVQLQIIQLPKFLPSRSDLTKLAVKHLDKAKQEILVEQQEKLTAIEDRKQKLLALPHIGGIDE